jgi:hypothetical protein
VSKTKLTSLLCPTEKVTEEQLATDRNLLAFERSIQRLSRRGFLGTFAAAAAAAAVSGGTRASAQTAVPASQVLSVLNFALNLEYLEANFYLYGSTGSGLSSTYTNGGPAPTGAPTGITFDSYTLSVIKALAQDEMNHIEQIQATITALGGTPIAQPAINYAAMGQITTQAQYLAASRQFTAVGNSAYCGGAQLLVSNPTVLTVAGQILGAEGQHAGALNYCCVAQNIVSPPVDAQDVPPSSTEYFTVYPTSSSTPALSPIRNTSQVLGIVYGVSTAATTTPPAGVTKGGFFPNGVNGSITST